MAGYGRHVAFFWNGIPLDGVRERALIIDGVAADITSDENNGYRALLGEDATKKIDYTISGITKSKTLKEAKKTGNIKGIVYIAYPDGTMILFRALLGVYIEGKKYNDAVTFTARFMSTGRIAVTQYISSVPYPVYATDEMAGDGLPLAARQFDGLFVDEVFADGVPLGGELRNVLITLTPDPELLAASGVPQSGTLVQTLFEKFITVSDPELLSASGVPQSGTLVQTFFPINHTVFDIEQISANGVPLGGTLT